MKTNRGIQMGLETQLGGILLTKIAAGNSDEVRFNKFLTDH